jgi:hypothetical protein
MKRTSEIKLIKNIFLSSFIEKPKAKQKRGLLKSQKRKKLQIHQPVILKSLDEILGQLQEKFSELVVAHC